MIINVAGGGGLTNKDFDDAYALVEEMERHHNLQGSEHGSVDEILKKGGLYNVSVLDHINAKVDAYFKNNISVNYLAHSIPTCKICGVGNRIGNLYIMMATSEPIQDMANFVNNSQWWSPCSNTYNPV